MNEALKESQEKSKQVEEMNETVQDLKMEIETINKNRVMEFWRWKTPGM